MQLSEYDVMQIAKSQQHIADSQSIPDLQARTLARISKLLRSEICVFMRDPEQRVTTDRRIVTLGFDAATEFHAQANFKDNPLALWARHMRNRWRIPVAIPTRMTDRLRNTFLDEHFIQPFRIQHTMAIGLLQDGQYLGLIGVFRRDNEPEFGAEDLNKAILISFHVLSTLRRYRVEEDLLDSKRIVAAISLGAEHRGVIVTNSQFEISYRNLPAMEIVEKLKSPAERDTRGLNSLPQALYGRCLRFAEAGTASETFECDVPKGGYALQVKIYRCEHRDAPPGYAIYLTPDSSTLPHLKKMQTLGLTTREIDVVNAVATGLTTSQIADRLCISFFTVQSHLKSIYCKLDVHNRAGVLNRIANVEFA